MRLDSGHANMVKKELLIPLMVVNIVQYVAFGLGGLSLIGCAVYLVVMNRKVF